MGQGLPSMNKVRRREVFLHALHSANRLLINLQIARNKTGSLLSPVVCSLLMFTNLTCVNVEGETRTILSEENV